MLALFLTYNQEPGLQEDPVSNAAVDGFELPTFASTKTRIFAG
jgi:hypothetical protein